MSVWWQLEYQGLRFDTTMERACALHKEELRHFVDIWDLKNKNYIFHGWLQKPSFKLIDIEEDIRHKKLVEFYLPRKNVPVATSHASPRLREWVGIFLNDDDSFPVWDCQSRTY